MGPDSDSDYELVRDRRIIRSQHSKIVNCPQPHPSTAAFTLSAVHSVIGLPHISQGTFSFGLAIN